MNTDLVRRGDDLIFWGFAEGPSSESRSMPWWREVTLIHKCKDGDDVLVRRENLDPVALGTCRHCQLWLP